MLYLGYSTSFEEKEANKTNHKKARREAKK